MTKVEFLGLITIAKNSGEELVENEILPQCWEQLTHKFVERRLLVVESCIAMIPYVTVSNHRSCMKILQLMILRVQFETHFFFLFYNKC